MDVRCERCRAQYAFDDDQVTTQGLTVRCTACGHVFRVKKKELVVTVAVSPDEVDEPPRPADEVTSRPRVGAALAGWTIRQAGGATMGFTDLSTLQRWIVERRVAREDEVTRGDGSWVRLGSLDELAPFFAVVEQAAPTPRAPAKGVTASYPPPPPPFPPPDARPPAPPPVPPPAAAPRPAAAPPAASPGSPPSPPPAEPRQRAQPSDELDPEELAAAGARRGGGGLVAVLLLLVALGGGAYLFAPAILSRPQPAPPEQAPAPAKPPPAPPVAAPEPQPRPPEPQVAAPPNPGPEPEAKPEAKLEAKPEAKPEARPEPAAPAGPKGLLARARGLREKGETAKALDQFGRVLQMEPDNVDALTGRGLCYFEMGQLAPAEASFQRALQLARDDADATMGLAETYRQAGRKGEAIALYQRYLAVHPNGEEAAVARNAISQLKE